MTIVKYRKVSIKNEDESQRNNHENIVCPKKANGYPKS